MNFILSIIDLFANAKNDWRLSKAKAVQNRALRNAIVLTISIALLAFVMFVCEPDAVGGLGLPIQVAIDFREVVWKGCFLLMVLCGGGVALCCLRAIHADIWPDFYDY